MSANPETVAILPPRTGRWHERLTRGRPEYASHAKILGGSIILLIGSVFVSAANFGYNIGVARMLGPADFSHAAAAVTILMLVSAVTLSFQLVCTKLVAKEEVIAGKAAIYQRLMKRAWATGLASGCFRAAGVLDADEVSAPVESVDHHPAGGWIGNLHPTGSEARRIAGYLPLQRPELEHGGGSHRQVRGRNCAHRDGFRRVGSSGRDFSLRDFCLLPA